MVLCEIDFDKCGGIFDSMEKLPHPPEIYSLYILHKHEIYLHVNVLFPSSQLSSTTEQYLEQDFRLIHIFDSAC